MIEKANFHIETIFDHETQTHFALLDPIEVQNKLNEIIDALNKLESFDEEKIGKTLVFLEPKTNLQKGNKWEK